jgi:hypothetical protein
MPLTLSLLTDDDVHAFAVVDDAAMADWPYAQAMGLNLPGPRLQMVEDWVRQGLTTDSTQTYLKVEDDETGEMVAGALWRFDDGAAVKRRMGEEGEEEKEEDEGAKKAKAFAKARMSMWVEFREGWFAGEAHASEFFFFFLTPLSLLLSFVYLEQHLTTDYLTNCECKTFKSSSRRPPTAAAALLRS